PARTRTRSSSSSSSTPRSGRSGAPLDASELVDRLLSGERFALSRAISHVEADTATGREVLARIYPRTGRAQTIGITGSAGAGKSTLVGALAREQRRRGRTVGI